MEKGKDIYTYDALAIVGIVSAVVHILVRILVQLYPKMSNLLLNIMIVVNIGLLVYYGMACCI